MEQYDKQYKEQEIVWGYEPSKLVEKSLDYLQPSSKVLDLGCGEGRNALFLAEKGHFLVAIDSSKEGVKKLCALAQKKRLDIIAEVMLIEEYLVRCPDYHAIFGIHIMQFIPENNIHNLFDQIKDKTNPGGINVFASFISKGEKHRSFQAKRGLYVFEKGELKRYYNDWDILYYKEYLGPVEDHGQGPHQHEIVEIIARKPQD